MRIGLFFCISGGVKKATVFWAGLLKPIFLGAHHLGF